MCALGAGPSHTTLDLPRESLPVTTLRMGVRAGMAGSSREQCKAKSFPAKDAKDTKEINSLTTKDAEDAKEYFSKSITHIQLPSFSRRGGCGAAGVVTVV